MRSNLYRYRNVPSTSYIHDRKTVLFLDEIHRFNKAQQVCFSPFLYVSISDELEDIFLPYIEKGQIQVFYQLMHHHTA